MNDVKFDIIAIEIQLMQALCIKSTHKVLHGFEVLMYEQLCQFNTAYVKLLHKNLEKGGNEGSSETTGGGTQSGTKL